MATKMYYWYEGQEEYWYDWALNELKYNKFEEEAKPVYDACIKILDTLKNAADDDDVNHEKVLAVINLITRFRPMTPLTDNPDEWIDDPNEIYKKRNTRWPGLVIDWEDKVIDCMFYEYQLPEGDRYIGTGSDKEVELPYVPYVDKYMQPSYTTWYQDYIEELLAYAHPGTHFGDFAQDLAKYIQDLRDKIDELEKNQ